MEKAIMKSNCGPVKLLLHCPNTARALQSGLTRSSQAVVEKFTTQIVQLLSVEVRWKLGHSRIIVNEQADKIARAALRDPPDLRDEQKYTFAAVNRLVRQQAEEAVES